MAAPGATAHRRVGERSLTHAPVSAEEATPDAAIRAIVEGAKLERLARGEATERTEQRDITDERLKELSDDELDRLLDQLGEGVGGEGAAEPR